jgi:hypothetical protein
MMMTRTIAEDLLYSSYWFDMILGLNFNEGQLFFSGTSISLHITFSLSLKLFRKQRWTYILVCLMQRVWPFFPENDEKEKS